MSPAATAFEKDVPYDYWLQHACGEQFEFLDQATTNLDGSPRPSYIERMRECPRCWAETNTEDALLSPGVGRPFPAGARGTNCLELGADEAVPDWLWRKFEGEFQLVDKFGEDERPYLETQGTDWFQLWAFANVANFGRGSHTMNKMGPDGSSLDFHFWFPHLPARVSDPWGMFSSKTAYDVSVFFNGKFQAHPKTEYPMLGYNYVSGIWQADGLRIASILESGGKMVFHYQWLEGQEAYLVNLTMYNSQLGLGTSIAKWERIIGSSNGTASIFKAHDGPRFPPAFLIASALLLLFLLAASIFGFLRGRAVGGRLMRQAAEQPATDPPKHNGAAAAGSKRAPPMV